MVEIDNGEEKQKKSEHLEKGIRIFLLEKKKREGREEWEEWRGRSQVPLDSSWLQG